MNIDVSVSCSTLIPAASRSPQQPPPTMTTNYKIALAAHNRAYNIYAEARLAYSAMVIGDSQFCSARKAFDSASEIYDAAFDAEASLEDAADDNDYYLIA